MKEPLALDPAQWLRSSPIPMNAPDKVLSAFDKGKPRTVFKFKGPHKFYRVAGWDETKSRMADPYGCWWVDETALAAVYSQIARLDMFEGWMPPEILAHVKSLPMHYRALTAVCEDWNDFREQVLLELPSNEVLIGLAGAVEPQPLRSSMDRASRKTPWLPGGVDQVFFKRATKDEKNINPFWVRWVKLW